MATYRLTIAYDGTGFHGYAANPGVRTVQGELEAALARVARGEVATVVAGRTDAGVHARANVVSFEGPDGLDPARLRRSVTSLLGPEIVATAAAVAADGFDARFSASWRRYRYRADTGETPDPLQRHTAWHVPHALDVDAMREAAGAMVGEHDFASLCRAAEGRTTVRTVLDARWEEAPPGLVFDVRALAFCHQMVRSMVALCVEVGRGRVAAAAVPGILEARDRGAARGAAPPHGLLLWEVGYPGAGA
ncbi:MAG: tRNA pseudouridine(38-40) synthase TruA [Actinobacteria bacterium]|nr:tRNA pseudouridine(38-40) synthase TruA [Actinomycetota bacterium]